MDSPKKNTLTINDLPNELIIECIAYLTSKDFKTFCLICTKFRSVAELHTISRVYVRGHDLNKIKLPICYVSDLYVSDPCANFAQFIESNKLIKNIHISEYCLSDNVMINACCSKLKSIESTLYNNLSESSSHHIPKCKALEIIRFKNCGRAIDTSIFDSLGNCPSLHTIITDCNNLTDDNVKIFSNNCNLKVVKFSQCDLLTDDALYYLSKCDKLILLKLSSKNITDSGIIHLSNIRHLTEINFFSCDKLTNKSIEIISHFPLTILKMRRLQNITCFGLNSLLYHPTLREIDLSYCQQLSDVIGEILKTCPKLCEINVNDIHLGQTFFKSIKQNNSIKKVYIYDVVAGRREICKVADDKESFIDLITRFRSGSPYSNSDSEPDYESGQI